MAVNWKSVSAPNFGSSNALAVQAGNTITSGIDRLAQSAQARADTNKKNSHAEFQHDLLDLSMNPDLNKNQFLSQALKLSKSNNLDPNQAMAQIAAIGGVRKKAESLDEEQTSNYNNLMETAKQTQVAGTANMQSNLQEWDSRNPSIGAYQRTEQDFIAGNGLEGALDKATANIPELDNVGKVRQQFLKYQGNYDDKVLARTINEVGAEHDEADIWSLWLTDTTSSVNRKAFESRLKRNQAEWDKGKKLLGVRTEYSAKLQAALLDKINKAVQEADDYKSNTKKSNLKSFSF